MDSPLKQATFIRIKEHSKENLGSGTDETKIAKLESALKIKIPEEYRIFLEEIGYAEIYGDQIYSIYNIPDEIPCHGLHWLNKKNEYLSDGFIRFFSNDIDGRFYIHEQSGKVYLNSKDNLFAKSFFDFINKMLSL
ncbi:SMI1/KNR4 family protein [Christiangramia flava]|uniref:Uncharacterized protein n=2 Tax=Christiangramia TaxID=292691 RepID=A0A1L7I7G9_9FLAO|nr:SMI1/KNR4 family protein [Christiangramia flava]APU69558.1 hypothetical protein GRFL_2834 [Christiangramia flava JLT2011]OSS37459.1 hypothetical protein C723_3627 [Christiangramia flava JLT2011]